MVIFISFLYFWITFKQPIIRLDSAVVLEPFIIAFLASLLSLTPLALAYYVYIHSSKKNLPDRVVAKAEVEEIELTTKEQDELFWGTDKHGNEMSYIDIKARESLIAELLGEPEVLETTTTACSLPGWVLPAASLCLPLLYLAWGYASCKPGLTIATSLGGKIVGLMEGTF